MSKTTATLEHSKAIIKVKAEMVERLPEPRSEDMSFIEYLTAEKWGFDADRYENDEDYRTEQNKYYYDAYLVRLDENKAFNELLDDIYSVLS